MPSSFLLCSWGNPGNLNPMLTAARALRARGHKIRVIAEIEHREETEKAGFQTLCWTRSPKLVRPPVAPDENASIVEIQYLFDHVMFGAAKDYAQDTLDALMAEPVDAVLASDILCGCVVAAEVFGLPCALLSPHISLRPLDGVPNIIGNEVWLGEDDGPAGKAGSDILVSMLKMSLPTLNRTRASFGLPQLRHIYDHFDRVDRVLIGMASAFDFPARRLPANLDYVGPLLDQPAWSRPWSPAWKEGSQRPRVLISFSTSFQDQASLLKRILAVVGVMDIEVVVTTGPAMEMESFLKPDNVTLLHSAPHDTVMKEVALVITHGGLGTVTRALLHHLPLLVIPMGRDQGSNSARVVRRGAGLALAETASDLELQKAIQQLLFDPSFRIAARRLGAAIASEVDPSRVAIHMETIVARRRRRSA